MAYAPVILLILCRIILANRKDKIRCYCCLLYTSDAADEFRTV
ncbi:MAG: hypothetical protein QUS66_08020 [Bacteroidota bacterium]|nr:hypothetical protein [Bacteroidota bacterium]